MVRTVPGALHAGQPTFGQIMYMRHTSTLTSMKLAFHTATLTELSGPHLILCLADNAGIGSQAC